MCGCTRPSGELHLQFLQCSAGKAGEPPSIAVARVLDCMETSNGLAKVGLSRAVKFRHG